MTADDLDAARQAGRQDAEQAINERAPDNPELKIAWAQGYGSVDAIEQAVQEARHAGVTWAKIADALGENHNTVRVRYTQQDRYQRRKARQEEG